MDDEDYEDGVPRGLMRWDCAWARAHVCVCVCVCVVYGWPILWRRGFARTQDAGLHECMYACAVYRLDHTYTHTYRHACTYTCEVPTGLWLLFGGVIHTYTYIYTYMLAYLQTCMHMHAHRPAALGGGLFPPIGRLRPNEGFEDEDVSRGFSR
jgi:hypothetical protein